MTATHSFPVTDSTPVLVGIGAVEQRIDDPLAAREPLELMIDAAIAAGRDCGRSEALRDLGAVFVPRGRWRYRDPGRAIAQRLGSGTAYSVLAKVGVLQEQLIATACERIRAGELDSALVVGGEAGYRLLRGRIRAVEVRDAQQESEPDEVWRAANVIMTEAEISGGLGQEAPPYYAVLDSALRHHNGTDLRSHRAAIAELYSAFSRIAAENPHGWRRSAVEAEFISEASAKNPMLAFPYTKLHTSDWSVDQASALLFCSAGRARSLGIDSQRWVFPLATAASNEMTPLSQRADLHLTPGADVAAQRALDHAGVAPEGLEHVDLYSCFPVAVLQHAKAVGLSSRRPLTVTGGMRFGGGPFNNYVLHATAQVARRLRGGSADAGLVSSVSGVLTKHAFSVWSGACNADYAFIDVSATAARLTAKKAVDERYEGPGRIAGYTVLYAENAPASAVAVVDTPDGTRAIARSTDAPVLADMVTAECTGRDVQIRDQNFDLQMTGAP